ncbi:PAS domain-containing sensor histidine kinase [Longimicrobium sp.]|uniref:PAS domain-containing sensor histidine kinase n=1 Tax=Longimicrobium sp. TaxID=2029185 RepID=UPI002E310B74|nr:PAS domain-containing sensor histidine kinase [Longimicrobium sp.]HEX6036974.1 PAS domain-containing sensor histidine kinase [Longimicrobium sp.]
MEADRTLYQLLVESVRDYAIFALDPGGHILTWNAGAQRFKGYTRAEIVGQHFSVFYPPEEQAAGKPAWELEVAARTGVYEEEGWRVRKDGSRFWANVVITALRDADGVLVGYGKVTRDLTERRRTEDLLRQSEDRFQMLVQSVREYGIFMLDREGRISSWNDGAQRIEGYTAEEIIGRHFSVFYPLDDVDRGKPAWELEVASREGRYEEEGWRLRKDGARFWASVVITALRDPTGELVGFAKVTRDLTERREASQRAMEDARRIAAAEASSRTKSEFLTSMSHELRTPLNAIGGYAELLALEVHGPVTEPQARDLERITASQRHLLSIINDILDYGRLESGNTQFEITSVELAETLEAVAAMVEPQAGARELRMVVIPCPGVCVRADRLRVQQILLNLVSNAVKFTEAGGRVTVACAARQGMGLVRVEDTGIGISPDEAESIFEPFVQLGRTLTGGPAGTGLGLAISRDLARGMGGDLVVESTPGQGSVFTLTLPLEE